MTVFANILQPLIDVFATILSAIHSVIPSWGWSIVALTVMVRALMLPLAFKQYRSMRKMQELAPQIKEIQAKYKEDRQRLAQEMQKFYAAEKVNPLASCLPLLFQLPVFIGLFYTLQSDLRLDICGQDKVSCGDIPNPNGDEVFLFIPDLTDNATGGVLIALLVMYVASQLFSTLLMSSATANKQQRYIFLALPFVFIPFILNFPAGLLVYWITTNTWTIVQQWLIRRRVGAPIKPPPVTREDGSEPSFLEKLTGGMAGGPTPAATSPNGGNKSARPKAGTGAKSGGGGSAAPRSGPPPKSPRKKKKRSGRRR